jgi:AraC-like DNA-binding protein
MKDFMLLPQHFDPRVLYIMRRSFAGRSETVSHAHDHVSVIYILDGAASYEIGGRTFRVEAGMLFICNPGVTHHRVVGERERLSEFQAGLTNLTLKGLPPGCLLPPGDDPAIPLLHHSQAFHNCCEEIAMEQKRNDPASPLMLKCLVMKLIVILLKEKYIHTDSSAKMDFTLEKYEKNNIVDAIVSFMNDNYMQPISLARISENAYLSPVYISRVFKELMGESPINYLIRVRLAKACEHMQQQPGISIRSAAASVGYDDAYYFSKLFKKHYGVSPREYMMMQEKPLFKVLREMDAQSLQAVN